jgi:hypothetical protein
MRRMDVGVIGRLKPNRSSMRKEHGQQLGTDMTNNFMLMTLFSIVADMAEKCGRPSNRCGEDAARFNR